MSAEKSDDDSSTDLSEHTRLRDKLKARYGLAGEYIGASTVALILGLGRTTVHDRVKANRFVIPHRLVDRKPLFLIDDLVAWMVGSEYPRDRAHSAQNHQTANVAEAPDPAPAFKHADARDAYLRMCERRGIPPHC